MSDVERRFEDIIAALDEAGKEAELHMLRHQQPNLRDTVALAMLQSMFRFDNGAFRGVDEAVQEAFEYADAFMERRMKGAEV